MGKAFCVFKDWDWHQLVGLSTNREPRRDTTSSDPVSISSLERRSIALIKRSETLINSGSLASKIRLATLRILEEKGTGGDFIKRLAALSQDSFSVLGPSARLGLEA
ncbi:hypothetical protein H0G86_000644 [Trichoderma simmonsii]|uniref:Uncharacterized protein n=1 Tax=Trichoderma simmonsii TaxID=1491479 RepID=A0A8G0L5B5_9HYPO|nr:hypothetical protein H0G86_000644 [Trichoderma simmonsii]